MLMRLRKVVEGPATPVAALSAGLNVTTGCQDAPLPYSLQTPIERAPGDRGRGAGARSRRRATRRSTRRPCRRSSYVDDCLQWPQDRRTPPFTGPLPDVPGAAARRPARHAHAGRERARHAAAAAARHARDGAGTGHDVLDSDLTGCSATALRRFIDGQRGRSPCKGQSSQIPPLPLPPRVDRRLPLRAGRRRAPRPRAVRHARHRRGGAPGRASVRAVGARAARRRAARRALQPEPDGESVRLRDYAFVPGVRLTGTVRITLAVAARPRDGQGAERDQRRARPQLPRRRARAPRPQARALPRAARALGERRGLAAHRGPRDPAAPARADGPPPRRCPDRAFRRREGFCRAQANRAQARQEEKP